MWCGTGCTPWLISQEALDLLKPLHPRGHGGWRKTPACYEVSHQADSYRTAEVILGWKLGWKVELSMRQTQQATESRHPVHRGAAFATPQVQR